MSERTHFNFPSREGFEIFVNGANKISILVHDSNAEDLHEIIAFEPMDIPGIIEALKRCMETALETERKVSPWAGAI